MRKIKRDGDSGIMRSKRYLEKKKGVSPVIATVLLIVIVVVIGLIIFLWFRSLTEEAVTKFGGTNIQLVCEDVDFLVQYNSNTGVLSVSNVGNVPIHNINLRITEDRSHKTENLLELSGSENWNNEWPLIGLRQGDGFQSGDLKLVFSNANNVLAIPVLMGTSTKGDQTHVCDDRHGKEVII